jgi:hypothetical protein
VCEGGGLCVHVSEGWATMGESARFLWVCVFFGCVCVVRPQPHVLRLGEVLALEADHAAFWGGEGGGCVRACACVCVCVWCE